MDRSWILDGALGSSVAAVSFMYGFVHLPWMQRVLAAFSLGTGLTLFAHYFLRRLMRRAAPSKEEMEHDLAALEVQIVQGRFSTPEEEMGLLEQAGALALALEHWPKAAAHYQRLVASMENWCAQQPPAVQEEFRSKRLHFQLAISFALTQGGKTAEGLEALTLLREESRDSKEPSLRLLVELFYVRALLAESPEDAESLLGDILEDARTWGKEIEGLRMVASEWNELGQPQRALELLQEAESLLGEDAEYATRTELYCEMLLAYSEAGSLKEAARLYVRLTQSYLHTNLPHPAVLEQLHKTLQQRFDRAALSNALQDAQRSR
ncbi:MAG: hypothetical protein H6728_14610 [Myxococcales bacterium]|nr:hypothetical protein [Myxococcales bacterium]MCB9644301.1 hypothetical protein [Myxococcales bacterium]